MQENLAADNFFEKWKHLPWWPSQCNSNSVAESMTNSVEWEEANLLK